MKRSAKVSHTWLANTVLFVRDEFKHITSKSLQRHFHFAMW